MGDSQLGGMVDAFTLVGETAGNLGFPAVGTFGLLTIATNLTHAALITGGVVERDSAILSP